MADEGFTAEELVQACNKVLVYAGLIARVANVEEVRVVCSSTGLLVAVLEGFLQHRLDDVVREPTTPDDRAFNFDIVVDVLSQILGTDLTHISGERIVEGSLEDISNLLELLAALCHGQPLLDPPPGPDSAKDPAAAAAALRGEEPEREEQQETQAAAGVDEDQEQVSDGEGPAEEAYASDDYEGESPGGLQGSDDGAGVGPSKADTAGKAAQAGHDAVTQRRPGAAPDRQLHDLHAPLSPIPEVSREDGGSAQQEGPGPNGPKPRPPRQKPRHAAGLGRPRDSAGGASSVISIPSDVGDASHADTDLGSGSYRDLVRPHSRPPGPESSLSADHNDSLSTGTLMERALNQAEATLRELGHKYEDFYHNDEAGEKGSRKPRGKSARQKHGQGRRAARSSKDGASSKDGGSSRSSGMEAHKPARRVLRAGAWPDGGTGTVQQHKSFLRKAKRALSGAQSADGSEAPSRSSRGSKPPRPSGRKPAGPTGLTPLAGVASEGQVGTGRFKDPYSTLLRAVRGEDQSGYDVTKDGRQLLQRSAAAYGSVLPPQPRGRAKAGSGRSVGHAFSQPGMSLSADLESKLQYVYRLASENPKQRAAREAVQHLEVTDELLCQARRRELVDRLSSARARREQTLRLIADRLQEQGREYDKRVEQLRLQRLADEWSAKQRSAQMKRALQAELALREAFMEVLEGEKEVLLAERQDAKVTEMFPLYRSAMRKAEREYMAVYGTLESLLATERQQRVRSDREALLAQRQENQLAGTVVRDRMREVLARIANEEEAIMQRYSISTRPEKRLELVGQIRRLLGLL